MPNPIVKSLCALSLGLLLACSGPSTPAPAPTPSANQSASPTSSKFDQAHITKELDRYLSRHGAEYGRSHRFSGYAHLVSGDRVLYSKSFGFADRKSWREHTAETSFRIGSVTKQFTAAAIMLLVQDGKLRVGDSISAHLPDYPAKVGARVTIHQLLNHTSGIPSYTAMPELMKTRERARSVSQMLALFQDKPLEFEPGSQMKYNNSGYAVLGAIIERVSGLSYGEFLRTRLFAPAGLSRTVVGDAKGDKNRAQAYEIGDEGRLVAAHAIDMSVPYAAGAIRSTANDMVKWDRFLRKGKVLTIPSQKIMWQTEKVTRKQGSGYGYGWLVTESLDTFVHHGGGIDGFSTYFLRAMKSDLVLVLYANRSGGNVTAIKEVMVAVAFGGQAPAESKGGRLALDPTETAAIVGSYALTAESRDAAKKLGVGEEVLETIATVAIQQAGKGLRIVPVGQDGTEIFRKSPNHYIAPEVQGKLVFEHVDGRDKAARLVLTQGPLSLTFARQ